MTVSKKDFEWFANWIKKKKIGRKIVNDLIEYFKQENKSFDESRFLIACELQEEVM